MHASPDAFTGSASIAAQGGPAIEVASVSVRFDTPRGPVRALDDVSLTVRQGEFVSIIGRSGCGKSTLLRCVADLLPPSDGRIAVMGRPVAEYARRRRFGFVFQDAALLPWRTALGNVELPMQIIGRPDPAERAARARDLLALVRLGGFEDHYPAQLSGGMRQRVAIARALSYEPEILLMDEPFGALDEFTRREMRDELLRVWRARPLTVLFVTHSLAEALALSDRVVVMSPRPGRVKAVVEVKAARPESRANPDFLCQTAELEELLDER